MRLSFALAALAGLLLAGATAAHADAPPAAPIFYCPTPGKADPAPATPPAGKGHVARASRHRHPGCPVVQTAARRRRHRQHGAATTIAQQTAPQPARDDVSAAQAFIYRYERALHGLDARAADRAWAEGRREGPALAQREAPPLPCPHGCPGPDAWRHDGAPAAHAYAQSAPPPVEERPAPPPVLRAPPPPVAPPPPPRRAYAWQDDHSGYRYDEREQESERAGGWRYSEIDGQGRYQHWGDRFAGDPAWDDRDEGPYDDDRGERYRAPPRYRCPPPVPASACSAGPDAPVRHSDVAAAGRDAAGYLTWPGKTE
ncbi:MAG: hypothetical protein WDM85_09410 [Caulobacteraceae bacterium]